MKQETSPKSPSSLDKKLASILAIGVTGGVASTAQGAVMMGINNQTLDTSNFRIGTANTRLTRTVDISAPGFQLVFQAEISGNTNTSELITIKLDEGELRANANSFVVGTLATGQTWSQVGVGTNQDIAQKVVNFDSGMGRSTEPSTGSYTNGYLSFRFTDPSDSQTKYGWIEASLTLSPPTSTAGPILQLGNWAWETTGQRLGTGETTVIPEPSSIAMMGAAGLLLGGAAGLRSWRRKKAEKSS